MNLLLGISLVLAFFLMVNMAGTVLTWGVWRLIARPVRFLSVDSRAQIIFALRIAPGVAALVFVFAFHVPAYLLYEPENSGEIVSAKLAMIAIASSIAVCIAIYRLCKTCIVTHLLAVRWQKNAVKITIPGVNVPVFRIIHPFPVMAVVGVIRPRIFVAEQVLWSLSSDELQAAVAHEYGHLRSHDNLKRIILRVCRDLLILPLGAGLDKAWSENAEPAADEYAARSCRSAALSLASALVKLARIAPQHTGPVTFQGTYLIHERRDDVTARVRRLLRLSEGNGFSRRRTAYTLPTWICSTFFAGFLMALLIDQRLLKTTHSAIEHFVWVIQ